MTQQQTERKLREDLSPQEREQAEQIGSLDYKSHRKMNRRVMKFIPSKEQH